MLFCHAISHQVPATEKEQITGDIQLLLNAPRQKTRTRGENYFSDKKDLGKKLKRQGRIMWHPH